METFSVLITDANRQRLAQIAAEKVLAAPEGHTISIGPENRSKAQNRYMWPYLTCFAQQLEWPVMVNGDWKREYMSEYDWKDLFTGTFEAETRRMAMGLEGTGLVMLGRHTSAYNKQKFSDFISYMQAFGDQKNVRFVLPGDQRAA